MQTVRLFKYPMQVFFGECAVGFDVKRDDRARFDFTRGIAEKLQSEAIGRQDFEILIHGKTGHWRVVVQHVVALFVRRVRDIRPSAIE